MKPTKPLKEFDYKLVGPQLEGLYFNVERALQKRLGVVSANNANDKRCEELLVVMLRFARNSYNAVRYLAADTPPDPSRKANYVLIVPNINRQLLDLLFSLVYMLDDLVPRSLAFQKAGWRDLLEEKKLFMSRFSNDDAWENFFESVDGQLALMVSRFGISVAEQQDPNLVDYWKTPFKLSKRNGVSKPFLEFLEQWIYKDVSSQAHLGFAGLQKVSSFLVSDLLGEAVPVSSQDRAMKLRYQNCKR
jgi:hypothetical protein